MVAVVSENDTQINKHFSPVFLDTGACDSKILSAQSTHPCRQHYSRKAPAGWCAAGQGRTLLGTSLEHSLTEAPPANEGGQISRRFLLLLHRRTALLSETSTAHINENWAGGALLREAQGKQRIRMVLEVTCAAQHQWGRETGSGRRKAEYPAGVGESTHPTQGQQGWWHTTKFCNFWQSLVLLPHCLLPLKRWNFKATRTTHKK